MVREGLFERGEGWALSWFKGMGRWKIGGLEFNCIVDQVDGHATSGYGCQEVWIHKVGKKKLGNLHYILVAPFYATTIVMMVAMPIPC